MGLADVEGLGDTAEGLADGVWTLGCARGGDVLTVLHEATASIAATTGTAKTSRADRRRMMTSALRAQLSGWLTGASR